MAHQQAQLAQKRAEQGRNARLADLWSLVHFLTGVLFGWVMPPVIALVIMILWEPLEILVLSPLLARAGLDFGYESWRNSLSDIVVDALGVAVGYYLLLHLAAPPVELFWHHPLPN